MNDSRLRRHLVRQHGRAGTEFAGLPPADLHRFEHVEQSLGLITLGHQHVADSAAHRPDHPDR
jgi:hypothetical protein